jgi:hypothetical protein
VNCFIQALNLISEQQEAVCCRRDFTEVSITFFSSRIFYVVPCSSVFLLEDKNKALIYLHTFTFIQVAIVYASYMSFQKVFLALNNYLHLKMASP